MANRKNNTKRKKLPRWAWWLGGTVVAAIYIAIFYYFFVGPTGFRWRAIYGDAQYPEGYETQGIDISHHQGEIDWERLQEALINKCPIRFVIIKSTEGSSLVDENFYDNFHQAREFGFIRGAYHFWSTKSSARDQAYFFLNKVKLEEGDLPPVLDVEVKSKDEDIEDFQRDILTWLHIIEDRYHVKRFDDYPFWISHYYVDKIKYKGEWKFWQHTDAGQLPGIKGHVDLNIYNGSVYDLKQLCIQE